MKFSQGVVVDLAETAALPDKIKEKYEAGGASVPIVIFSDPQLTQTFGRFDYPAMKSQKFSKIFEAAKKEIQAAKDDGTFSNTVEKAVVVEISDSKIETWKSAAGTEIKAKLVGVKNDSIYLFETAEGKTITAKADQLDQDSVTRARKLAGLSD